MSYHYETLFLLPSDVAEKDVKALEKQLETLTKAANGSVKSFDTWGRYRLAYAVCKHDTGIYMLARYVVSETTEFFKKFESYLRVRCTESVLRYVHVNLDEEEYNRPYSRPEPVDAPSDRPRRPERPGRENRGSRGAAVASKITESAPVKAAPAKEVAPAAEKAEEAPVTETKNESVEG